MGRDIPVPCSRARALCASGEGSRPPAEAPPAPAQVGPGCWGRSRRAWLGPQPEALTVARRRHEEVACPVPGAKENANVCGPTRGLLAARPRFPSSLPALHRTEPLALLLTSAEGALPRLCSDEHGAVRLCRRSHLGGEMYQPPRRPPRETRLCLGDVCSGAASPGRPFRPLSVSVQRGSCSRRRRARQCPQGGRVTPGWRAGLLTAVCLIMPGKSLEGALVGWG